MGIVERLRDPVNNWNSGGRFAAADHIEALEASVVGLTQERDFHRETADLHAERIARAADLIERLKEYTRHGPLCYRILQDEPYVCVCGLTALIKEIEGE